MKFPIFKIFSLCTANFAIALGKNWIMLWAMIFNPDPPILNSITCLSGNRNNDGVHLSTVYGQQFFS